MGYGICYSGYNPAYLPRLLSAAESISPQPSRFKGPGEGGKRLAKASRRKWGKGGRGLRGSVGRVMGRLFLGRVRS